MNDCETGEGDGEVGSGFYSMTGSVNGEKNDNDFHRALESVSDVETGNDCDCDFGFDFDSDFDSDFDGLAPKI